MISSDNLVIIGGAEDKQGERVILRRFVTLAGGQNARIVVLTAATTVGLIAGREYTCVFGDLGVHRVTVVNIAERFQAMDEGLADIIRSASGVFFTGGDQLRITSLLGGSVVGLALKEAYHDGVVVAGTSAGASAISEIMIVGGTDDHEPTKAVVQLAAGLGLLPNVVIDQHFAQRGRIGRLLGVVAQSPQILGIGIDENTAIHVSDKKSIEVVGGGTVTILDGRFTTLTNASETKRNEPLCLTDVKLHVLAPGYRFDLEKRIPFGKQDEQQEDASFVN